MSGRQLVMTAPGRLEFREIDDPVPGPHDVLVRPRAVGICGSDLHALAGHHPFIDLPCAPGHEVAGVVEAVGEAVEDYRPGDRVLVEPNLVCGHCPYCTSGRYNLCDHLAVFGCQTSGAMADRFTIPATRLHHVPDGLDDRAAALVEPLSTGTHAVRGVGDLTGRTVAVLGAGSIGLLTMLAAKAAGAAAVAVTDLAPGKRDRAARVGADVVVDAADAAAVTIVRDGLGGRPDVTFDCVAVQTTTDQAVQLALKGGTIVVVGVPVGPVQIPLPLIQDRELVIRGTAMFVREDVQRAIELIEEGLVPVHEIVTATLPFDQGVEAFALAGTESQVKVQLAFD